MTWSESFSGVSNTYSYSTYQGYVSPGKPPNKFQKWLLPPPSPAARKALHNDAQRRLHNPPSEIDPTDPRSPRSPEYGNAATMNSKNKYETGPAQGWESVQHVDVRAMDEKAMPSDAATRARAKSAEIMASLKKGEPGDADKAMGKSQNETGRLVPLGWVKRKLSGGEKPEKKGKDAMVR